MTPQMRIFVPSRSRWERSITLEALRGAWPAELIQLVVPSDQHQQYNALALKHDIAYIPVAKDGIAAARETCGGFALHYQRDGYANDKFLMLDDDLRFAHRPGIGPKLTPCTKQQMRAMLYTVQTYLDTFAHVAISARQGNNTLPLYCVECSRPLRALAYRAEAFLKCEHGRVQIMEDFDVTLQLLRMGYKNAVITSYVQDQYRTNALGGCSDYRTHELHEKNVRKLAKLHPGLVVLRDKENTSRQVKRDGMYKRLEATIYWEKAYASSQK